METPDSNPSAKHPGAGHRQRLRERFLKTGFDGFSEHEVLELLLTLCIPRRDVKEPAKALLARHGSLREVLDASLESLRETPGLGEVAPVALRIIRESAGLYLRQSAEGAVVLNNAKLLEDFWRSRLGGLRHEVFEVAFLDKSYRLLRGGVERLEEGVADSAVVYPRCILEAALRHSASVVVLAHNHPTGRTEPSLEDIAMTNAIAAAAKNLGLVVLDHMIVGADTVFSFRRAGMMPV